VAMPMRNTSLLPAASIAPATAINARAAHLGRGQILVDEVLELMVRRHLVALAAFLMQPHPPAFARGVIILDLHADDGADARGICMGCSPGDRGFADSQLEEGRFEPSVPAGDQRGRLGSSLQTTTRHRPESPTASIQVALLIRLAIQSASLSRVGPAVRIRCPPAESQSEFDWAAPPGIIQIMAGYGARHQGGTASSNPACSSRESS
jgi:hypothetical protein